MTSSTRTDRDRLVLELGPAFCGRFELGAELGAGGMARVFKAVDRDLGRNVAIKIQKRDPGFEEASFQRFLFEARAGARISDPHVVAVHDCDAHGEHWWIVSELVEGCSLETELHRSGGTLGPATALTAASHVAGGLAALHGAGLIHRDIKAENILIDAVSEQYKIADLGLAWSDDREFLTKSGVILGTPLYIAPEQVEGRSEPRSDLYALGTLMFYMLTGRFPFNTNDAIAAVRARMVCDAPTLRIGQLDRALAGPLDDLVHSLLQRDPEARPQSAAELVPLIERLGRRAREGRLGEPLGAGQSRRIPGSQPEPRAQSAVPATATVQVSAGLKDKAGRPRDRHSSRTQVTGPTGGADSGRRQSARTRVTGRPEVPSASPAQGLAAPPRRAIGMGAGVIVLVAMLVGASRQWGDRSTPAKDGPSLTQVVATAKPGPSAQEVADLFTKLALDLDSCGFGLTLDDEGPVKRSLISMKVDSVHRVLERRIGPTANGRPFERLLKMRRTPGVPLVAQLALYRSLSRFAPLALALGDVKGRWTKEAPRAGPLPACAPDLAELLGDIVPTRLSMDTCSLTIDAQTPIYPLTNRAGADLLVSILPDLAHWDMSQDDIGGEQMKRFNANMMRGAFRTVWANPSFYGTNGLHKAPGSGPSMLQLGNWTTTPLNEGEPRLVEPEFEATLAAGTDRPDLRWALVADVIELTPLAALRISIPLSRGAEKAQIEAWVSLTDPSHFRSNDPDRTTQTWCHRTRFTVTLPAGFAPSKGSRIGLRYGALKPSGAKTVEIDSEAHPAFDDTALGTELIRVSCLVHRPRWVRVASPKTSSTP